jgi:hypothetical protein
MVDARATTTNSRCRRLAARVEDKVCIVTVFGATRLLL